MILKLLLSLLITVKSYQITLKLSKSNCSLHSFSESINILSVSGNKTKINTCKSIKKPFYRSTVQICSDCFELFGILKKIDEIRLESDQLINFMVKIKNKEFNLLKNGKKGFLGIVTDKNYLIIQNKENLHPKYQFLELNNDGKLTLSDEIKYISKPSNCLFVYYLMGLDSFMINEVINEKEELLIHHFYNYSGVLFSLFVPLVLILFFILIYTLIKVNKSINSELTSKIVELHEVNETNLSSGADSSKNREGLEDMEVDGNCNEIVHADNNDSSDNCENCRNCHTSDNCENADNYDTSVNVDNDLLINFINDISISTESSELSYGAVQDDNLKIANDLNFNLLNTISCLEPALSENKAKFCDFESDCEAIFNDFESDCNLVLNISEDA